MPLLRITLSKAIQTVEARDGSQYQKVCTISPRGDKLVSGSTEGKLLFLSYPAMEKTIDPINHQGEVLDADWHNDNNQVCQFFHRIIRINSDDSVYQCLVTFATSTTPTPEKHSFQLKVQQ